MLNETFFTEESEGNTFEATCTFRRSFAGRASDDITNVGVQMREIPYDESLVWMTGYNIYPTAQSVFRYVYGYSYDSDLRNLKAIIKADALSGYSAMMALTLVTSGISLLF